MLASLEAESNARAAASDHRQMPLFEGAPGEDPPPDRLRELVDSVDPDTMSPREALEILYKLKGLLE